ncbi:MAG: hypothetical protein OXG99_05750 [Alphaproteobacteria bacterium]|nr:hypothetical protein [Alphaproteobacteria bacterium]
MGEIELTDEDLKLLQDQTALTAFIAATARAIQLLGQGPYGKDAEDFFLKALQESLKKVSSGLARHPMAEKEREQLRQWYRVFLGFYRHPSLPENLPPDATKH